MIMYNRNLIMNKGQRNQKRGPSHSIIYQYSSKISKAKKLPNQLAKIALSVVVNWLKERVNLVSLSLVQIIQNANIHATPQARLNLKKKSQVKLA